MNEEGLRKAVEKSGKAVTDNLWEYLFDKGYVEDALTKDFDEERVRFIIGEIDAIKSAAAPHKSDAPPVEDGPPSENGARPGPFAVDLDDAERERALLFLEAQIRAAANDLRVQGFRDRYRPDGPLTPEDAERLLETGPRELESLGSYLHKYYGWHEGEGKWWALTGEMPSARPVRVSYRNSQILDAPGVYLITIEAPPWISPTTFQGAFVEMRRRMHAERKLPEARSVRVVRFVESLRNDTATEKPTFAEMWRRWNESHPDEAFSEPRTFERAYSRTAKVLHRQYHTEIGREETPELSRQRARRKKERERLRERSAKYRPF